MLFADFPSYRRYIIPGNVPVRGKNGAATERRNPRSRGLDLKPALGIVRTIHAEDHTVTTAVGRELRSIARAVDVIVARIRRGGRLVYVGAGTSGRLAVLDAAECPPTFGTKPETVQALIAGGKRALTRAVEGAEDSPALGKQDVATIRVGPCDAVVGIAASGRTPYVLGALAEAHRRGAATIGVTTDKRSPVARAVQISIAVNTGPEVITGSTRMKAGTAQKMVLNMLSTAVMTRLGHVYDNWMIGVALTNQKLRRRGLRILEEATGASVAEAGQALRKARHDLRVALVMLKRGVKAGEAKMLLGKAGGSLRKALGEL